MNKFFLFLLLIPFISYSKEVWLSCKYTREIVWDLDYLYSYDTKILQRYSKGKPLLEYKCKETDLYINCELFLDRGKPIEEKRYGIININRKNLEIYREFNDRDLISNKFSQEVFNGICKIYEKENKI